MGQGRRIRLLQSRALITIEYSLWPAGHLMLLTVTGADRILLLPTAGAVGRRLPISDAARKLLMSVATSAERLLSVVSARCWSCDIVGAESFPHRPPVEHELRRCGLSFPSKLFTSGSAAGSTFGCLAFSP